jgi:hypothetical protein
MSTHKWHKPIKINYKIFRNAGKRTKIFIKPPKTSTYSNWQKSKAIASCTTYLMVREQLKLHPWKQTDCLNLMYDMKN